MASVLRTVAMSKQETFDFSHLDEEYDDGDTAAPIGDVSLELDVQPHLSGPGQDAPVQTQAESRVDDSRPVNPSLEFDDNFVDISKPSQSSSLNSVHEINNQPNANDAPQPESNSSPSQGNVSSSPTGIQIQYNNSQGQVSVMQGGVQTRPDGSRYINTHGISEQWSDIERQRPLRPSRMRFLKIFSIAACIFFFPTGIPSVYYAFRTETEFHEGIMRGNIDRAQKFAKRSERFGILSFVLFVVLGALIVAGLERPHWENYEGNGAIVG